MKWEMQGKEFNGDLALLDVGQYDIFLGNAWLYNYSPMIVDMKKVQLAITVDNKPF